MEKTIKVSVIMLAYNIGKYVETAIKGVLRQKRTMPSSSSLAKIAVRTIHSTFACATNNSIRK